MGHVSPQLTLNPNVNKASLCMNKRSVIFIDEIAHRLRMTPIVGQLGISSQIDTTTTTIEQPNTDIYTKDEAESKSIENLNYWT